MGSNRDLTGMRFGRLTVVGDDGRRTHRNVIMWHCICDCGNHKYVPTDYLTSGDTRSCGCLFKEISKRPKHISHGDATSNGEYPRLYKTWIGMRRRCYDSTIESYRNYGGRGISVCDEWDKYENFKSWAISNGYRDDLSIDRIDVNGDYEPSNCRWANNIEQGNNRRANRLVEYDGQTHTVKEWSRLTGIRNDTLTRRLNNGWEIKDALTRPTRVRKESTPGITYNGETHSIIEWSRITGISYSALVQRLGDGWTVEDALTVPVRQLYRSKR